MNPNNEPADNDPSEISPKRLRSSEPDIEVVLGSGENEVTKSYHSQTLAVKSKYIDAMLSTPMQESEAHKITFPDIEVGVWDDMMKFLDSPSAVRTMTERDALKVAVFYDKYEFEGGTKLCDDLLADFFKSLKSMENTLSVDVDLLVDAMAVASKANLWNALKSGVEYVWGKMHSSELTYSYTYVCTMFTAKHMKSLAPILLHAFEHKDKIGHRVEGVHRGSLQFHDYDRNFIPIMSGAGNELCRELKLDSPDFGKSYVLACSQLSEEMLLHRCIKYIQLLQFGAANGNYFKDDDEFYYPDRYEYTMNTTVPYLPGGQGDAKMVVTKFRREIIGSQSEDRDERDVQLSQNDWALIAYYGVTNWPPEHAEILEGIVTEKVCWIAPCSKNLNFPPREGWKPVDPSIAWYANPTLRDPTISYILKERI